MWSRQLWAVWLQEWGRRVRALVPRVPKVIDLYAARNAWRARGQSVPITIREMCPTPWWWFACRDRDRDCLVTWRSRAWWWQVREDLRWWPLRVGLWVGIRDLVEGGWYKDARWSWPWKARAPGWRQPTRTIYTWPIYGVPEYRLRVLSSRVPATFRKATG